MTRLVFDMDNTLADFDSMGGVPKMYEDGYFLSLPAYEGMTESLQDLFAKGMEIFIVSACIDSPTCMPNKMEWLEKFLPFIPKSNILLVPYGTNKAKAFIEKTGKAITETDFLFDDYKVNLIQWQEIGGTAVKMGKIYKPHRPYAQVIQFKNILEIVD